MIKLEQKFNIHMIDALASLTVAEENRHSSDSCEIPDKLLLSKDTNKLAKAISDTFSEEERRELVSKLCSL